MALTAGCVSLVLATAVALLLLVRFRDVVFGLAFTWSMASIWVAGFSANDDYRVRGREPRVRRVGMGSACAQAQHGERESVCGGGVGV